VFSPSLGPLFDLLWLKLQILLGLKVTNVRLPLPRAFRSWPCFLALAIGILVGANDRGLARDRGRQGHQLEPAPGTWVNARNAANQAQGQLSQARQDHLERPANAGARRTGRPADRDRGHRLAAEQHRVRGAPRPSRPRAGPWTPWAVFRRARAARLDRAGRWACEAGTPSRSRASPSASARSIVNGSGVANRMHKDLPDNPARRLHRRRVGDLLPLAASRPGNRSGEGAARGVRERTRGRGSTPRACRPSGWRSRATDPSQIGW